MITRLARVAVRWPVQVLSTWVVVIGVLALIGLPVQDKLLPADLFIPGTQSYRWEQLKAPNYGLAIAAAIQGPAPLIDQAGPQLTRALAARPLTRVQGPWSPGAGAVASVLRRSPNEAVLALDVRIPRGQNSSTVVPPLQRFIDARLPHGVRAYLSGDSPLGRELNNAGFESLHKGEIIAAPLLVLILLLVFRSPIAAAIPLIIAGGTVGAGLGVLRIFTAFTELDIMALSLASMMGLALGVDYALLLVSRFREALDAGRPPRDAATLAANTAGRTAIFAGCVLSGLMITVIVLSPGSLLRSAATGAIIVTVIAMLSGLMVCPAILTLLGHRVNKWAIGGGKEGGLIPRIVRFVSSRPALAGALVLAVLLLLASPVLALKTTPPDPNQLPHGNPALVAYDQIRKAGLGPNIDIALRKQDGGAITSVRDLRAVQTFEDELRRIPNVSFVAGPGVIAPQSDLLQQAPAQIRAAGRQLTRAHAELNRRIDQVRAARGLLSADKTRLSTGLAGAESLLAEGQQMLSGVGGELGQLGQLVSGLGAASAGASQLRGGAQTVQAGAAQLASALALIRNRVAAAVPQVQAADKQIRTAQADFGLLRVPAQVTQSQLEAAQASLDQATVGNGDPAVLQAKLHVAAALAADRGGIPGYNGLASSLAQAESEASRAGDQADQAVRQIGYLADAMVRTADGAGRIVRPGLSTIIAGLQQLASGLTDARDRVAAAEPRIASTERNAEALLASGQAQLQQAGAVAFPQLATAQAELTQAGNRLTQVRDQLVSKSGPFKPLREVDQIQRESPFLFSSPYMIVAALQGTRPLTRRTVNTVVDSGTGGNVGQIVILPNVPTNSPGQNRVVSSVRTLTTAFARQNGFRAAAGGSAAELVDYNDAMASRVPEIIIALCLITYLMLVPIFRSVVLPAIAVVLNVLTVTVAMGIVTCFSVSGVIATPAPIGGAGRPDIVAVTAVFCIIFALSIDYYVFLLTRMREEYVRTQSNRQAVLFGIEKTGRIVTGAAAIMIGTFFAFTLTNFTIVRELGIGLTSAILVDATLVRLGMLPAVMRLFGDWTWWMPRWLDDRLPLIDIEGSAFEHAAEQQPSAGSLAGAPGFV
jgi:RND superfamily putative drug exporter